MGPELQQEPLSTHDWLCNLLSTVMDEDNPIDIPKDPNTPIKSLVLDNLGIVTTSEAIEEHFQIRINDEELDAFVTTGDISEFIDRKIARKT